MKTIRNWVWLSGLALLLGTGVVSANAPSYYRVLHHFAGGPPMVLSRWIPC